MQILELFPKMCYRHPSNLDLWTFDNPSHWVQMNICSIFKEFPCTLKRDRGTWRQNVCSYGYFWCRGMKTRHYTVRTWPHCAVSWCCKPQHDCAQWSQPQICCCTLSTQVVREADSCVVVSNNAYIFQKESFRYIRLYSCPAYVYLHFKVDVYVHVHRLRKKNIISSQGVWNYIIKIKPFKPFLLHFVTYIHMAFCNMHEIKNLGLKLEMCLFPVSWAEWLPLVFIVVC